MYKEIYLMLTEACPNRCEYCYIKGRDNPKTMTFEQIENIIETERPTRILFFGGEPLLCLDLIEKTMEKYYSKIKFQIVTSTVVNFKEFIELEDCIQVSSDILNELTEEDITFRNITFSEF